MTTHVVDFKLENYAVHLRGDGIMQVEINALAEISKEEVVQGTDIIMEIVKDQKFPVLFVANEFSVPSKESRDYLAEKNSLPYSKADAYVIHSFPQKIVGNFYLKVNKPARPTKIFTDKNQAIDWLKTFL